MDKVSKFLDRLTKKEFLIAQKLIESILAGDVAGLDIKKLRGTTHLFRVRKGDARIIFSRKGNMVRIVEIERRGESTYRNIGGK